MTQYRVTLEVGKNVIREDRVSFEKACEMVDVRLDPKTARSGVFGQISKLEKGKKLTIRMNVSNLVIRVA